ncbi:probable disease resistance protein At1g62630 isoform X2 [Prosopis cineraria]|nr:probable disease resistance protein At1g62630 isoform X2 [Prosopis cineraria]XP_054778591.1 probable disease resistance protein At1g62630 isoform X2 [Prosopis cineraria]
MEEEEHELFYEEEEDEPIYEEEEDEEEEDGPIYEEEEDELIYEDGPIYEEEEDEEEEDGLISEEEEDEEEEDGPTYEEEEPKDVAVAVILANERTSIDLEAMLGGDDILENVMKALADPNTHLIGIYGPHEGTKHSLLELVGRRVDRDQMFDKVLTVTVTRKSSYFSFAMKTETPDVKKIQEDIARQLGFNFNHKSTNKRAQELTDGIKKEQRILIELCDLFKGLDLGKIGIPYGADHPGCKLLLTSAVEGVLSNQMHTQKNFNLDY